MLHVAPHTRCVDWNQFIRIGENYDDCRTSHEVRGLKCKCSDLVSCWNGVAPHTRCVDWNWPYCYHVCFYIVAPHTRCVDWNGFVPDDNVLCSSRTSHEVRGLKYSVASEWRDFFMSHLTRGAWIEIGHPCRNKRIFRCRTSHEVRGLKCYVRLLECSRYRRTSHEVRGLKFFWVTATFIESCRTSHEVRGLKYTSLINNN